MSPWISPATLTPEIELLVRRWELPHERIAEVTRLLAAQSEGGTACRLLPLTPTQPAAWGSACQVPPPTPGDVTAAPSPLVLRHHAGQPHRTHQGGLAQKALSPGAIARFSGPSAPRSGLLPRGPSP